MQDLFSLKEKVAMVTGAAQGIGREIALGFAQYGADIIAVDLNDKAVGCTLSNLERNGLQAQVRRSDLFSDVHGRFDLILFNPPYLIGEGENDMERSWAGGKDGVEVLGRFLSQASDHLAPGGRAVVLLSTTMKEDALTRMLAPFRRRRLGSRKLFFEKLWVEELSVPVR